MGEYMVRSPIQTGSKKKGDKKTYLPGSKITLNDEQAKRHQHSLLLPPKQEEKLLKLDPRAALAGPTGAVVEPTEEEAAEYQKLLGELNAPPAPRIRGRGKSQPVSTGVPPEGKGGGASTTGKEK